MFKLFSKPESITVEDFMFCDVDARKTPSFVAAFTNAGKTEVARISCNQNHLRQLAKIAGRHYAGIRIVGNRGTMHWEGHQRRMFINNAILYLRKTRLSKKDRHHLNNAYILDFMIETSNSGNDMEWLAEEMPRNRKALIDKYREYLRFEKLTKDARIARHCAGLEDLHLYQCAYLFYNSSEEEGSEPVPVPEW